MDPGALWRSAFFLRLDSIMSSGVSSPSVCAQAGGIVTGDAVYSGVLLAIDSSLVPEEKRAETPSMRDGLELHTETELRILGCELIQSAGILLRLPQVAMATGQVLFQRFFYSKSFIKHNCEIVSIACMNLASKIEECPRRVRDVINVFHHLKQGGGRRSAPLFLDQTYINTKNQVIRAERRVLKELGFCVHVKHPHKMIVMYMQVLECERNQTLVQTAWNYMNDALRTDVFVRFEPETIACACIYLAARNLQIPLPSNPHWFLLFGASECEIREICVSTLKLYSRSKPDIAQLEKEVEKKKTCLEEEKLKSVNYNMTPALSHNNTFSPASKPGSPRALKTEDEREEREEREERALNSRIRCDVHSKSSVKKEQIEVLQNGHVPSRGRSTSSSPPTGRSGSGTYSSRSSRSPSPRRRRRQRSPQVPSHESRHGDRRRRSRSCGDSQGRRHDDAKHRQESRERGERERSRDRGRARVDGRKKHERGTRSAHSQQRR